jgi:hypothetical protein
MADRYWVGGTGTWNTTSTTVWSASSGGPSGASVPTAADNVIFDQAATYTVTMSGALACLNFTVTAGTVTFASTGSVTVSGDFTLCTGTVWTNSGTLTFNSTTTQNITTAGTSMGATIIFNGVGGAWTLVDALTIPTRIFTLTNGTLNMNNKNVTCSALSCNNSNTRAINFGTGQFYCGANGATTVNLSTGTNLTLTGSRLIEATYSGATGTRTLNGPTSASATANNIPNFKVSAGTDTLTLVNNMQNLDFTGFSGTLNAGTRAIAGNLTLSSGMTLAAGTNTTTFYGSSGTNTITTNGKTLDFPITFNGYGATWQLQDALTVGSTRTLTLSGGTLSLKAGTTNSAGTFAFSGSNTSPIVLNSTTPGTQATISQTTGTVTPTYAYITDSAATGGAAWTGLAANNVTDGGNNTGWTFDIPYAGIAVLYGDTLRSFTERRRF